ncbi:fad binding domain-containing protein [Diplodia corticola]|uniref:Fad binding domain-containing protein n=1 Tax=Diplodia corticola TaxID=236234 RepID=A0A1J9RKT2_9PEZI|nr:fad binding domain-containing protein [Diplodia corticola]OJD29127.1 fad binding domain-containing protein [Diplodia corticola]
MRLPLLLALVIAALLVLGARSNASDPSDRRVREALASLLGAPLDQLPEAQLVAALDAGSTDGHACSFACYALSLRYGGGVAQSGSEGYSGFRDEFWSLQQASQRPSCIFQPSSANEVAVAVQLSRLLQCPFAVKSGGHAAFAGASNIEGGITIDMKAMNHVDLLSTRHLAALGPGAKWFDVYNALEPEGLSVVGGRVSAIGVGGLTLGGGISFFSGLYGWACDNVVNYEVVIANGSIINVSRDVEPDLFWALRGGGNNFGIVTNFTVTTFSQGLMWGGGRLHRLGQRDKIIEAFANFGSNAEQDPKAAMILSFAYSQGEYLAQIDMQYAEPVRNPPIFENFSSSALPDPVFDTTMVRTLSNLTQLFNESNPDGLRETYWTATYRNNADLVSFILDTYIEEIDPIRNCSGLLPACTLQFITPPMFKHMREHGGNALGLDDEDEPLLLLNLNTMWHNELDDDAVLDAANNIIQKVNEKARSMGLDHEYVYMNYASQYQDPIAGYGQENKDRLTAIAEKYDPENVFQKLQPGYFKLGAAPSAPCVGSMTCYGKILS